MRPTKIHSMEVEIAKDDFPLRLDVSDDIDVDPGADSVKTPKHASLSSDSPFLSVERLLRVDHGVDGDTKEKNPIISLAVNPADDRVVATGGHEGGVRIWRLPKADGSLDPVSTDAISLTQASQITTLVGHAGQVNAVRFSPGGDMLASGSADSTVRIFASHGSSWKMVHCLRFHSLDVTDLAWFSPTLVVSTSTDRNTVVWDAVTGGRMQALYSDKGSCPKGVSVDPKGEYLSVLFDEGLVDIYRRNSDGKFRLSRHLDLAKNDPANFARAFKTTLYARRAAWSPNGQNLVFPLGSRGRLGPCGVEYERLNFMDPTPGETLAASKALLGHPSRVVVASIHPCMLMRTADDSASTADAFYITALVSVDGVVSFWASSFDKPIAVVANVTGPLRVCTDATWSGNTLLLSASDGSVTAVTLYNVGSPVVIARPAIAAAAVPSGGTHGDVKSAQVEVRVGGKRKIQPVIANNGAVSSPAHEHVLEHAFKPAIELRSISADSTLIVRNQIGSECHFDITVDGNDIFKSSGAVSSVTHVESLVVLGRVENNEFMLQIVTPSAQGEWKQSSACVLFPDVVRKLSLTADGYLSFIVGETSLCVWKYEHGEFHAVYDDIQISGISTSEMIEMIKVTEGVPSLVLKTGKTIRYNPRIHRWTADT